MVSVIARLRSVSCATAVASLALCAATCGPNERSGAGADDADASGSLLVYTVNYPLAYFAERIGGDEVEVDFPAPADVDPAFWSPAADAIAAYQRADLILLNGAGYADWIEMAPLPSVTVNTSEGFADLYIEEADAAIHTHGPEGEHSHGAVAFTTWLDPTLAARQAAAIEAALSAALPSSAPSLRAGLDSLLSDLSALDTRLARAFGRVGGRPLLASHPVYQYLARRYDLNLVSVHFEPDESPSAEMWSRLEDILEGHPARLMLWEGEPLAETTARLRRLGIGVVIFEPAGNRPGSGDFLTVMAANAAALEGARAAVE